MVMFDKEIEIFEHVQAGVYKAYMARPTEGEDLPAVLVLHEAWGLDSDIKTITRRFAAQGYVALALDLYSANDSNRLICILKTIKDVIKNSLESSHLGLLDQAAEFLQAQPQVSKTALGVIGFCMGGSFALALAVHNEHIKASSVFYGINPKPLSTVAKACPVVGSYPANDFTSVAGKKLEVALTQHNKPHDIKVYPKTKHSFFNETSRNYNSEAAADSWQRTLSFFDQHLTDKK